VESGSPGVRRKVREERVQRVVLLEPARQLVHVGDVDDLDPSGKEGAGDLAGDLRSLLLVGGGKGLVEEDHSTRPQLAGDLAHPRQFLVELAAAHLGVLLTLEVGEEAVAYVGGEGVGADEEAALHHRLGEAEAAQEGRLAALVGAGDDDQRVPGGVDRVADQLRLGAQGEPDVIEAVGAQHRLSRATRGRDADRLPAAGELFVEVQRTDVEADLGQQRGEEVDDMVGRLLGGLGDQVDALVMKVAE